MSTAVERVQWYVDARSVRGRYADKISAVNDGGDGRDVVTLTHSDLSKLLAELSAAQRHSIPRERGLSLRNLADEAEWLGLTGDDRDLYEDKPHRFVQEKLAELERTKKRCWSICSGNELHGRVFEYRSDCLECGMTRADYDRVLNPPEATP